MDIKELERKKAECLEQAKAYQNQIDKLYEDRRQRLKLIQDKCDHEYLPSGGKWTPQSQMTCIYCNKII